jgi:hypothetical protein
MASWVCTLKSESAVNFYVGQTNELEERVRPSTAGRVIATRHRRPWQPMRQKNKAT